MTEKLIAHPLPVARPAQPRTMLEVVRSYAPQIHDSIVSPRKPELDALSHVLKKEIASQPGICPDLGARIYSLPDASVAMILLNVYRPRENGRIRTYDPEVAEFIARWKGDATEVPLPESVAHEPDDSGTMPGSSQSFETFMRRRRDGQQPECDEDPGPSEFSDILTTAMEDVERLTMGNTGLLEKMVAEASEFLACFLVAQPEAAAARLSIAEKATLDRRHFSDMQPEGAYAEIGCGEDGVTSIQALDRKLVLIDNSILMTKMLSSYLSKLGRRDAEVRNTDILSADYGEASLGFANIEFVLHYFSEGQIADVIGRLAPALAYNGLMHIREPEMGCCDLDNPKKINAIRSALAMHGLFVAENKEKNVHPWLGYCMGCTVEFVAARREEELGRARRMMDSAQFTKFA